MRIVFILPFAGKAGGIRVVASYARALTAQGHEVHVVSQPFAPQIPRSQKLRIALGMARAPQGDPTTLLEFLGPRHIVLDRARPVLAGDFPDADAVIATWWETAEWVAALPLEKGRKYYLLQGYEIFPYLPRDRVIATFALPLKKIAVSNYVRDEIAGNHGATGIEVAENGVDVTHFDAPPRHRNRAMRVGLVYSTVECKNVGLALTALARARARCPDLQAVIFSAHTPPPDLPVLDWAGFHLHPAESDIPGLYASADLWLFTSDHEGFGLPILEAMACRTPVLATRAGAAPQLVDGTNGTLLPSDPDAFADEIARFAAMDPETWQAFSDAAYATGRAHSWDRAADRLLALLN